MRLADSSGQFFAPNDEDHLASRIFFATVDSHMGVRSNFIAVLIICSLVPARADDLPIGEFDSQYCGPPSLRPFKCTDFDPLRDDMIARICYDSKGDVTVIKLKKYAYCYCGLGSAKFDEFLQSKEMGQYYNREIQGRFHCASDTRPR